MRFDAFILLAELDAYLVIFDRAAPHPLSIGTWDLSWGFKPLVKPLVVGDLY